MNFLSKKQTLRRGLSQIFPLLPRYTSIHGIVPVYKPGGISSNKYLQELRTLVTETIIEKRIQEELPASRYQVFKAIHENIRMGHGGTLDPMAEGVLPIGINMGCKDLSMFLQGKKSYRFVCLLGQSTDTGDILGKTVTTADFSHITREMVEKAVQEKFTGEIQQRVPM
jgi:tRNA pseudouridine55 synthase